MLEVTELTLDLFSCNHIKNNFKELLAIEASKLASKIKFTSTEDSFIAAKIIINNF